MNDAGLWVGAIGLLVTVASFGYAVYTARRGAREKRVAYEVLQPAPLADAVSPGSDIRVALTYQEGQSSPVTVNAVFVQYLRFANFGKLPIKNDDSARTDPFRVEAEGGNPLSISLVSSSRQVCQFRLSEVVRTKGRINAQIDFDFMDYSDGALLQILSESSDTKTQLKGTIIGMPGGIVRAKERRNEVSFPDLGCVIPLIIELFAVAAVPFIYRHIAGTWQNAWLLLLPVVAIVLPLLMTLPVVFFLTARQPFQFSSGLQPPCHYSSRVSMYMRRKFSESERRARDISEEEARKSG